MRRRKSSTIVNIPSKGLWVLCRVCPHCGRFVVKLRVADQKRKFVICYFKGWDGSPWFTETERDHELERSVPGNAVRHNVRGRKKPRAPVEGLDTEEYYKNRAAEKEAAKDPFFSLETGPSSGSVLSKESPDNRPPER